MAGQGGISIARIIEGISVLILGGLLVWLAGETLTTVEFRARGDRCTAQRCGEFERRLHALEIRELPPPLLLYRVDRLERHVFDGSLPPDSGP